MAKAAIPASTTAPTDATVLAAPPVYPGMGGLVVVPLVGVVVLEPPAAVPLPVETKLAHVRRVVLLVWMTMERLPKKEPTPERVET